MHNTLACCALSTVLVLSFLTPDAGSAQVDADQVRGIDLAAAVNLVKEDVKAWGHSRAGNVGAAFTLSQPKRTIAFVLYQSAAMLSVRSDADIRIVSQVPALIIEGITAPDVADASKSLWRRGRAVGAPWAFVLQPDAPHGSEEYRAKANDLVIAWMAAVLRLRLSGEGPHLRSIDDNAAWLGLSETADIASSGTFAGAKAQANWLPDEASARAWRALIGAAR